MLERALLNTFLLWGNAWDNVVKWVVVDGGLRFNFRAPSHTKTSSVLDWKFVLISNYIIASVRYGRVGRV